MEKYFIKVFKTFLGVLLLSSPLNAQTLMPPKGEVLLTVSGAISETNVGDTAQFDRDMLLALGTREFVTETIWTEGLQTFEGVPLRALADRLGIEAKTLIATAVNEYATEIPAEDIADDSALLALERNGQPMSVREMGPIWLIYPFDSDARFRTETYHARSIWQLVRLDAKP